jgi:hypothetical protein
MQEQGYYHHRTTQDEWELQKHFNDVDDNAGMTAERAMEIQEGMVKIAIKSRNAHRETLARKHPQSTKQTRSPMPRSRQRQTRRPARSRAVTSMTATQGSDSGDSDQGDPAKPLFAALPVSITAQKIEPPTFPNPASENSVSSTSSHTRNKLKPKQLAALPAIEHFDHSMLPLMLDETRASQFLGVSRSFLRKARTEGAPGDRTPGPCLVKIGGRRLYRVDDLCAWVQGLKGQEVI